MNNKIIMMNYKRSINITFAILALFISACGGKEPLATTEESAATPKDTVAAASHEVRLTADQYRLAAIETGSIEMRNLSSIIRLNGVIDVEPSSMATVSAPLGGYIRTAGLLPGQPVKKGQVLATVENPEFITMQQDYLESLGRFQFLEQELKRQQKLREEDVNAAKTLEQISSEHKIMQARIAGLQQKMALAGISSKTLAAGGNISRTANIYAPIGGYVKASNVNIGKYVNPTDVLFELVNKDDLHLALQALEKDAAKLKTGQTVKFSLANENNFNRTASIFLIGKAASDDRNIPVHCHLQSQHKSALLPGMYVKAWIETGTSKQQAVPTEAVVQLEGKDYIIVQAAETPQGYTFRLVQIAKGVEMEGYTAITLPEHVNASEIKVVVKNAYSILSALKNAQEEEE